MITIVAGNKEQKLTTYISANFKQGQWGFLDGEDSDGNTQVTPVGSTAHAQKSRHKLGIVGKATIAINKGDSSYETIYITGGGDENDDGRLPYFLEGAGFVIEDNELNGRVAADFDSAEYGDNMCLTVSGYATLVGASDAASSGTVVAYFDNIKGDSVTYRTI